MQSVRKLEVKENVVNKNNNTKKEGKKKKRRDRRKVGGDEAPLAIGRRMGVNQPMINNTGRMCVIRHREFVGEILGNSTFKVQHALVLNPGMMLSFPWLSKMASNWEQYSFKNLIYNYIPRCSTLTSGSIMLVPDYDSLDQSPASKSSALSYSDSIEDSSWKSLSCRLRKESLQPIGPKKYIRSGNVAGDLKTYDGGKMLVCVQGQADTSVIGDLWVSYDIHLFVPQTESQDGPTRANNYYQPNTPTIGLGNGILTFPGQVGDPLRITVTNNQIFTPPKGTYWVCYSGTLGGNGGTEISTSIAFYINGSAHANTEVTQETFSNYSGTNPEVNLFTQHVITFNGTDTLEVRYYIGGAVNSAFQRHGQLLFMLV